MSQIEEPLPVSPGGQVAQLIAAHDQHQHDLRAKLVAQGAKRVDGIGLAAADHLAVVDRQSFSRTDITQREPDHLEPLRCTDAGRALLP